MSRRQVVASIGKIGIRICSGSVCKIHTSASQILKDPYEEIKKHSLVKDHLNADEASWKTLAKIRWIWIGCSRDSVFFEIKTSRSSRAFQEVFGVFKGGLTPIVMVHTMHIKGYGSFVGLMQTVILRKLQAGRGLIK